MNLEGLGQFVRSEESQNGIGKLVEINGAASVIEFFDSPTAAERPRVSVKTSSVVRVPLEPQTRVFFLDQTSGNWRAGRVEDHIDNTCNVALPNKERARVQESDAYVRWWRPIRDPSAHLASRLTETPFFHEARAKLLAVFVEQRAAAAGLTGLLSAPICLERHQVEVVRRVLQDPLQRYFLADEVGLGKTIEAGIVIRQYVLDHRKDHRVLVIAPEQLIGQWRTELHERFQVGEKYGHQITIVALEELLKQMPESLKAGLVVIDEAHQAVAGWDRDANTQEGARFELLRRITAPDSSRRLLLLSATPVRRNEDGFLALLHLLDPALYRLSDRDAFRAKVTKRQALADLFYAFREEQQSFFLEGMMEELGAMFPGDHRLSALLERIRPWLEPGAAEDAPERRVAIRAVRTHLSETYRLHRRLLRNRRTSEVEGLLPGRAGLASLACDDEIARMAEAALERWRGVVIGAMWGREDSAEARTLGRIYAIFLESAWCDLNALACCVAARLRKTDATRKSASFGRLTTPDRIQVLSEAELVLEEQAILAELWKTLTDAREPNAPRLAQLAAAAEAQIARGRRVVILASSPALADQLHALVSRGRRVPVWRHRLDDDTWHGFRNATTLGILVCDFRAEEGLNLQGGKTCMLHADPPFSPNRLEQRLGRLDRFGVADSVCSFALHPEGCPMFAAWLDCLQNTYQVFDRSIAALQYVVDDEMRVFFDAILAEGETALRQSSSRLAGPSGVLEKELKAIRAQDELDSIEILTQDDAPDLTAAIEALEEQSATMEAACDAWLADRLHFYCSGRSRSSSIKMIHPGPSICPSHK